MEQISKPIDEELLEFHSSLLKIGRSLNKSIRNRLKTAGGIPVNQYRILKKLGKTPKLYISDLKKKFEIKKGNISRLIDQLEKLHYVKRGRDKQDKRKVYITITELGIQALQKISAEERKIISEIYGSFPKDKIQEYMNILNDLHEHLKVEL